MRIAITGAGGFVGRRLSAAAQEQGHDVIRLSRSGLGGRRWDPMSEPAPLEGAEAVIHLAGESLTGGRWTRSKMARIRSSRIVGTRHLIHGIHDARPRVLVSASAVGYYGDRGDEDLTEESDPGVDFLSTVCSAWEAEARASGIRTVVLRTGMVLGPGGALEKMIPPFTKGLGGVLGNGRQWMSWIHREDLVNLYLFAATREHLSGPVVATSPNPVQNEEFTRTLARVLDRPAAFRIPRWGARLAFGKVATVLFSSQRCRPLRAMEEGFRFVYPDLDSALLEAVGALRSRRERVA
jgi:uncharacterized protein (TIGR01777 family)